MTTETLFVCLLLAISVAVVVGLLCIILAIAGWDD